MSASSHKNSGPLSSNNFRVNLGVTTLGTAVPSTTGTLLLLEEAEEVESFDVDDLIGGEGNADKFESSCPCVGENCVYDSGLI